jgi:hypothetical protein
MSNVLRRLLLFSSGFAVAGSTKLERRLFSSDSDGFSLGAAAAAAAATFSWLESAAGRWIERAGLVAGGVVAGGAVGSAPASVGLVSSGRRGGDLGSTADVVRRLFSSDSLPVLDSLACREGTRKSVNRSTLLFEGLRGARTEGTGDLAASAGGGVFCGFSAMGSTRSLSRGAGGAPL